MFEVRPIEVAFAIGIVAGLRTLTAPAALALQRGGISVLSVVLVVAALGELVGDILPKTPSRTMWFAVVGRSLSGAICGGVIGASAGLVPHGVAAGIVGALVGTYGGHALRIAGIARTGPIPAALIEDAIAIGLAIWVVKF